MKRDAGETITNERKKPVKTWKKLVLFAVAQVLLASAVLMGYYAVAGSEVYVQGSYRDYTYQMDPFENETFFEDTDMFTSMLKNALDDITLMAVVKEQLETGGKYDGKKEIDITRYANRKDSDYEENVTAVFSLEDLLKWNKYGMEYTQKKVCIDRYDGSLYYNDSYYDENGSYQESTQITDYGEAGESVPTADEPTSEESLLIIEMNPDFATDQGYYMDGGYYFYPGQSVSSNDASDGEGYYDPAVWMEQSIDYYTPYAKFSDVYAGSDAVYGNVNILKCRYKTVDGKNLDQLVNNWEDYFTLVRNLDQTIANLSVNYEYYQSLCELYGENQSNVKYCMLMTMDGVTQYVSNLPEYNGNSKVISEQSVQTHFAKAYDKTLYYYPADMTFETNTRITEDDLFAILTNSYVEYAFPESTKIWIGIDTQYPAQDVFAQAAASFNSNTIPGKSLLLMSFVLVLVYIGILVYLCCKAGWEKDKNGKTVLYLNVFDRLHTEFVLAFAFLTAWLFIYFWYLVLDYSMISRLIRYQYHEVAYLVLGLSVAANGAVFGAFLLSLVRRIKGHNLWSDSFVVTVLYFFYKKWMESLRENKKNVFRGWAVYLLYLLLNFFAVFALAVEFVNRKNYALGVLYVLPMLCFDLWVGYRILRNIAERYQIIHGINKIRDGEISYQLQEPMHGENEVLREAVNNIGDGIRNAVETSMKDERLKADLITNVSHDIKTPLTSIINYVDLMKREHIQDEKLKGYIDILDAKSQRLKQLTEDLVEASKISSGNITYVFERINLTELLNQALGEFSEKFEQKGLVMVDNLAGQSAYILADSRRMWRVIENLFNNIYKYAMEHTRIYLTMTKEEDEAAGRVSVAVKNISAQPLNIDASELTERFIRGDVSRSTEGSGLGLSIAKNLTEAQHGGFEIYLDGDLFKVTITFPLAEEEEK